MISDFRLISVQEFAAKYIFITATTRLPRCYPKAFPNKDIFSVPLYHSNANFWILTLKSKRAGKKSKKPEKRSSEKIVCP